MAKRGGIDEPAPAVPGGGMPAWLEKAASPTLIPQLRYAIEREAAYPSRTELLRRLEAIEDAARLLMRELPNLQILYLLLDGDERIENEHEMFHGLRDMAARAERVRALNPRKQGSGKLYPEPATGPNLMEHCALIYAVVHHQAFGRWPKNDANARRACEALWKAAGGPRRSGGAKLRPLSPLINKPCSPSPVTKTKKSEAALNWGKLGSATVAVWKRHLTAAQKYRPPHPAGELIQHILAPAIRSRPSRVTGSVSKLLYEHPNWLELIEEERGGKKTE